MAEQQRTRSIVFDPFYDGHYGAANGQANGVVTTQMPTQTEYAPAGQDAVNNMRRGPSGLQGTIIPNATMGGIPIGTKPHMTSDILVNIDPHITNQNSSLHLGFLNSRTVQAALREAQAVTPEPTDIQSLRLRGAAVMHTLAKHEQAQHTPTEAHVAYQQPVVPQPVTAEQFVEPHGFPQAQSFQPQVPIQKQAQQTRRRISPLASFNPPPVGQPPVQQSPVQRLPVRQTPVPMQASAANIEVIFEFQGIGTFTAKYHDVDVNDDFVILIFDNHSGDAVKFFPPVQTNGQQMALHVVGSAEVYAVTTTGIQFEYNGIEFFVLKINQVGELPQEA